MTSLWRLATENLGRWRAEWSERRRSRNRPQHLLDEIQAAWGVQ